MKKRRILFSVIAILGLMISCNLPSAAPADSVTETPSATADVNSGALITDTPTLTATGVAVSTETPTLTATACSPTVIANTPVNVRSGPGIVYGIIGALVQGGSAKIAGKNYDGTWWYIDFVGGDSGHGWVGASVVTASCVPATLTVIAAPPTPLPASGTCKDNYVQRLIRSSDKVCVPPASKTQADADNAAASSRTIVGNYGSSACTQGYVWREAYVGDVVCVIPATRSQAQSDNAAAASRIDPLGAFGPNSCVAGYVWREATAGDVVCVTPAIRSQTASDNSSASSRVASADECVAGYVWRQAFGADRVCVTSAVQGQVAADNAAASSHTWP